MRAKRVEEILEGPAERFQEDLAVWLKKKDWSAEELVELLEGYGIPTAQDGEEPYLSLLEALPDGGDHYTAATELARRAAAVLNRKPDMHAIGDPSERLLYNLLFLCAGLSCPDELGDSLAAMWSRKKLAGEWQGLDLRYALTAALVANQIDSRMAPEWKALLQGRPSEFLVGHEYDGFEGVLWMPESPEKRGEPYLEEIGDALRTMADVLGERRTCRLDFRPLLKKVSETFPDRKDWDYTLILLADRHAFPVWAVECLPKLFLLKESRKGWFHLRNVKIVLMWNVLASCLPRGWKPRTTLCSGQIVEVELPESIYNQISRIAVHVEKLRIIFPLPGTKALRGAVSDLLGGIAVSRRLTKEKPFAKEGRPAILKENNVGFAT